MNLVIALLVTSQFLSKEQIRETVAGYNGDGVDDGSFDRMFERDKKELRELGIMIETGSNDSLFEDEIGYRIRRDEFELADILFTSEEAAVVGLAARVWQHAGLAGESSNAILKLKAAGIAVDPSVLTMVEPHLSANEPSFDRMWEAATQQIPVTFAYQRPGQEPRDRRVQPWGVLSWHGRWYMAGFDLDRDAERVFRLSRVRSEVSFAGESGSYSIPKGVDLRRIAQALFPAPAIADATISVRRGRCQDLRRQSETTVRVDDEWDEITVAYASPWQLASEIASFGPDAVVVAPADVREQVVAKLRSVLTAGE